MNAAGPAIVSPSMDTKPNDLQLFKPSPWLGDKISIALFPGGWHGSYWGDLEAFPPGGWHGTDAGPWVRVKEIDCDDGTVVATFELTALDLIRGLERMIQSDGAGARKHASWVLSENGDADTQDLLVQYACFGEARYG